MALRLEKRGWVSSSGDIRDVMLPRRGLFAYDISLIHYDYDVPQPDGDESMTMALSMRLADMVEESAIEVSTEAIFLSRAVFALNTVFSSLVTSGQTTGIGSHTMSFPKPFRVPFCAFILEGNFANDVHGSCELYYESVKVTADEMAYLIRQTEVIRTT